MRKQGLLTASFGVSHQDTWEKTIGAVEREMREAFPQWEMETAYTSPTIRRIWAERGRKVLSLGEAVDSLAAKGVKKLVVQPTHLICGWEYHSLRQTVLARAEKFEALSIGAPLLFAPEDYRQTACAAVKALPVAADEALVLMGHGTDHPMNAAYPAMAHTVRALGYSHVFVGTVEGWPQGEDVLEQVKQAGYRRAALAPLMLVAGDHAKNDMAGDQDSWKTLFEQGGVEVRCLLQGLGQLKEIRQIYLDHARQAMERL